MAIGQPGFTHYHNSDIWHAEVFYQETQIRSFQYKAQERIMNQRNKNIGLIGILGLLLLISIVLAIAPDSRTSTLENTKIFAVSDTAAIDQIVIKSNNKNISLKKENGTWVLNDQYKAEQNIVRVLLSILKDAEVVRQVPKSQMEEIANYILDNGYLVEISSNGDVTQNFYTSGNENKTLSYMMPADEESPMIVNIPGYESYVAGIFEIPPNDWRDRTILSTNWRTLQKLNVNYAQYPEYNFSIEFKFNFLNIEGIDNLDTAQMMTYIEQFNFLQADRYLDPGQNEKYDSLLETPETATMSISDIDPDNSKTIEFYPLLPDDPMMLGYVNEDDQMVLFLSSRIQSIFAVKEEFEVNANE